MLVLAGLGLSTSLAARAATYIWTPVVSANINAEDGEMFVDFRDDPIANPTPVHGYVIVHRGLTLTCDSSGGPGEGETQPDPTFVDNNECDPTTLPGR